jgi:ATP-dependent exoDNAse (exonuclease V) beta subunit
LHPRFRRDVQELIRAVFDAASVGLDAFARFKEERGLVDYVDMIDLALNALAQPAVHTTLGERLELCVVDEFQDTSPVQLELFSRLHSLCNRTFWVGDQKQCIFEYAGADPTLMDAVHRWVKEQGGKTEVLAQNHRSRPELVRAVSTLFAGAFATHGLAPEEVACEPARERAVGLDELPAFGVFHVSAKRGAEVPGIARGIVQLLESPAATPVLDPRTGH